jgi:hypothetical protein
MSGGFGTVEDGINTMMELDTNAKQADHIFQ